MLKALLKIRFKTNAIIVQRTETPVFIHRFRYEFETESLSELISIKSLDYYDIRWHRIILYWENTKLCYISCLYLNY